MLIFKNVKWNILKCVFLCAPNLWLVVGTWKKDSDELSQSSHLLVLDGDKDFFLCFVGFHWAIVDGIVLRSSAMLDAFRLCSKSKLR